MIFSFVELILEEGNYCRPDMKSSGALGIVQGRYGLFLFLTWGHI